jgi:hypothetical protein
MGLPFRRRERYSGLLECGAVYSTTFEKEAFIQVFMGPVFVLALSDYSQGGGA